MITTFRKISESNSTATTAMSARSTSCQPPSATPSTAYSISWCKPSATRGSPNTRCVTVSVIAAACVHQYG